MWFGGGMELTSTHNFSSGDLMEQTDMRGYMSKVLIVVDLRQQMIPDALSQKMCHLLLYHFKLVMYWECTNLAIVKTAD